MNKVKFCAFYKPLGVMVESDRLESINFDTKVLGVYIPIENKGFHRFRLSDFELMQYTGLHDNSDEETEIYSGHIVSYLFEGETIYCEVKYEAGGYLLASEEFEDGYIWITELTENDGDYFWTPECQVVGNIYLNSNLLNND
jgi:uncharacterized phage protein (TIGR01671 family)